MKLLARQAAGWMLTAGVLVPMTALAGPAVTIYSRDLGFVRETRTLELGAARDTVRIEDIPERIDVSSVRLTPAGGARVERLAYRYDVPSGEGALQHARGSRVRVSMRDARVVEGTLVAVDGAWLVVREPDGSIHTLGRHAVDDVRVLGVSWVALRPALEAVIDGGRRGRIEADLAYLTGGLSWSAEHTLVRNSETKATWSAGVTIENTTGRDFTDARLKLVAGEPHRASPPPMPMYARGAVAMDMAAEKSADLSEQSFSEYHLYTLERPALLRNQETQKLSMVEPHAVNVSARYLYRGGDPRGVRSQIEMRNTKEAGLGVPLPGGRVRIYEPDPQGELQFVGESTIQHTPEGDKLTLEVGSAFDLAAERRETAQRRISDREREVSVEIELRNRKKTDVTIVLEEGVSGDFEILQPSHKFTKKDANTIQFDVPVPAGRTVTVEYTARMRY